MQTIHHSYLSDIETDKLANIHNRMTKKAIDKYFLGNNPTVEEIIYLQTIHNELTNRFHLSGL